MGKGLGDKIAGLCFTWYFFLELRYIWHKIHSILPLFGTRLLSVFRECLGF